MTTTPLISLATAKIAVPVRLGNTDFDARLSALIMTASEDIESHTDRFFTYNGAVVQSFDTVPNITQSYDTYGGGWNETGVLHSARPQRYVLQNYPIDPNVPVVISYDPYRLFDISTVIDPSLYVVDYVKGIVTGQFGTGRTLAGLQISYAGGYQVDTVNNCLTGISGRLSLACATQVGFLWNKLHPDNVGMDADRTKGAANRASMVQKFLAHEGLCPEAASFIGYLKPLATGRY